MVGEVLGVRSDSVFGVRRGQSVWRGKLRSRKTGKKKRLRDHHELAPQEKTQSCFAGPPRKLQAALAIFLKRRKN